MTKRAPYNEPIADEKGLVSRVWHKWFIALGTTSGTNTGDITVTDSAEIDFTLTGQDLTGSLVAGSIDETKLDTSVNASLDLADSAIQVETDPVFLASPAFSVSAGDIVNLGNLSGTNTGDQISSNFTHNDLSGLNAGSDYEHITDTQKTDLVTLTNDSMADALHRHSELSASDGSPNPALSVDAAGLVGIGTTTPSHKLEIRDGAIMAGTDSSIGGALLFAAYYNGDDIVNTYGTQYSSSATVIGYAVKPSTLADNVFVSTANIAAQRAALVLDGDLEYLNAGNTVAAVGDDVTLTSRFIVKEGGNVGIGVVDPDTPLEIFKTSAQLKLSYDATHYVTFLATSGGALTITPSHLGVTIPAALDVTGVGTFGTSPNYATFATDGELTLAGTARVMKHIVLPISGGAGLANPTVRTTEAPYLSWTFAVNDDDHHSFPAPHDMDYTEPINIYIEWYTHLDQTDDEVNWQVMWNAKAAGEAVNAGSTTVTSGDVACPTQWFIADTLIGTIAGGSITADDVIGIDLTRIAIIDGTNPTVNSIHVLNFHIEYISNKLGEAT